MQSVTLVSAAHVFAHDQFSFFKQHILMSLYIHTYMNRPITAPELESKKLKCVQVNERVPDGYWPISS